MPEDEAEVAEAFFGPDGRHAFDYTYCCRMMLLGCVKAKLLKESE